MATRKVEIIEDSTGPVSTNTGVEVSRRSETYSMVESDTRNTALSKAGFEAIARDNRDKFAGSGFVEWGKHRSPTSTLVPVNEGLWTNTALANGFYMGDYLTPTGISKTNYSVASVNGSIQAFKYLNDSTGERCIIQLPPAPTVYPTGTTNHLITEGLAIAHADASNSGLILNGKFDTDTTGWTNNIATLDASSGTIRFHSTTDATIATYSQTFSTIVGKEYVIEFDYSGTSTNRYVRLSTTNSTNTAGELINLANAEVLVGRNSHTFVATTTSVYFKLQSYYVDNYVEFDNISVFPKDAISRSDLVFLESWHEDTSEKGVLYDLGNVQYKGTISAGTAGTFSGSDTYSLFGNWQEPNALVGNSISIASLTQAQLKTFVGKHENNCYYDGDKLIQVRYRVRSFSTQTDSPYRLDTQFTSPIEMLASSKGRLYPKGKQTSIQDDIGNTSSLLYFGGNEVTYSHTKETLSGVWKTAPSSAYGYTSECFALPIALVHRRNQGAYHPVFNGNGTSYWWKNDGTSSSQIFYSSTAKKTTSIANSFDFNPINSGVGDVSPFVNPNQGAIGQASGRPDALFYDQVHEGDITDLRSSAHNTNDMEVMNSVFNGAISGSERGSEGEHQLSPDNATGSNLYWKFDSDNAVLYGSAYKDVKDGGTARPLDKVTLVNGADMCVLQHIGNFNGPEIKWRRIYGVLGGTVGAVANTATTYYMTSFQSTRKKSNTITHCDIIGDPANYPQSWKDNGVIGTPLLVGENGEDYIFSDSLYHAVKLSKKATTIKLNLFSDDSGVTWITGGTTIDATTNTVNYQYPSGRIYMVFYTTHTNMAEPTVNSAVRDGVIGDVFSTVSSTNGVGINTLINKVLVGTSANDPRIASKSLDNKLIQSIDVTGIEANHGKLVTDAFTGMSNKLTHGAIIHGASNVPAVKVFPYLTTENGRKVVNLVFKEMKFDVDWGDDSKFNIVDNVSTTVDDNGKTVLIGQKKIVTPYFAKEK